MRKIRGIPERPVEDKRLGQSINHEDGPEDGDGFLPRAQGVWERWRLRTRSGPRFLVHRVGSRGAGGRSLICQSHAICNGRVYGNSIRETREDMTGEDGDREWEEQEGEIPDEVNLTDER